MTANDDFNERIKGRFDELVADCKSKTNTTKDLYACLDNACNKFLHPDAQKKCTDYIADIKMFDQNFVKKGKVNCRFCLRDLNEEPAIVAEQCHISCKEEMQKYGVSTGDLLVTDKFEFYNSMVLPLYPQFQTLNFEAPPIENVNAIWINVLNQSIPPYKQSLDIYNVFPLAFNQDTMYNFTPSDVSSKFEVTFYLDKDLGELLDTTNFHDKLSRRLAKLFEKTMTISKVLEIINGRWFLGFDADLIGRFVDKEDFVESRIEGALETTLGERRAQIQNGETEETMEEFEASEDYYEEQERDVLWNNIEAQFETERGEYKNTFFYTDALKPFIDFEELANAMIEDLFDPNHSDGRIINWLNYIMNDFQDHPSFVFYIYIYPQQDPLYYSYLSIPYIY